MNKNGLFTAIISGLVGYGIGSSKGGKISEQDVDNIIRRFLRQTSLEDLIGYWAKDNGFDGGCEGYVINRLREIADNMEEENDRKIEETFYT